MKMPYVISALFLALNLLAETKALSTNDRIYELEAELHTLKQEVQSVKELAGQERPNAFNPSISIVGDIGAQFGFNLPPKPEGKAKGHDHGFKNGFHINEIEFGFKGEVDPFADAAITFAIEPHGSHAKVHLEEAFFRLKQWPGLGFAPLGILIKAGQFKTAFGRINQVHRHNLPQINYPLATKSFLGDEGHSAPGLSISTSFNPRARTALHLTLEGVFGRLTLQEEGAEKIPNGILHAWWHEEAGSHFSDIGLSGLLGRRGAANSGSFLMFGVDGHYSYLPERYGLDPLFLFGFEIYLANKGKGISTWPLGEFVWAQVRLFNRSFFGVLYDLVIDEQSAPHALGGYLTHYTTEFLRFRLGYEHVMPDISSFNGDHRFMLSMIFVLGSHPVEPYFINR